MLKRVLLSLLLIGAVWIGFASCSSPSSDGEEAARAFVRCEQKAFEFRKRKYKELLENFSSYDFKRRSEVREYIERIDAEAVVHSEQAQAAAEEHYLRAARKYASDYREALAFEEAFTSYRAQHGVDESELRAEKEAIEERIKRMSSPLPDRDQLMEDLIGRSITDQRDGYHKQGWSWEFQEGDIKELEILKAKKAGNEYVLDVRLVFQRGGGAQEAHVLVTYGLKAGEDWAIEFIESRSLAMVRTGKYDRCVTIERRWEGFLNIGGYVLDFTNHCDVALVVAGKLYVEHVGWKRFAVVVPASSKESIGGGFQSYIEDYKVDFIERP